MGWLPWGREEVGWQRLAVDTGLCMREMPHPCTMCTYHVCSDSGAVSFWYICDPIYSSLQSVSKVWAPFLQLGVCEAPGGEMTLTQSQCPPGWVSGSGSGRPSVVWHVRKHESLEMHVLMLGASGSRF